jgi:hypothetical protein
MKFHLIILFILICSISVFAQEDAKPSPISFSGYLETYYVYDFNEPENNIRPPFVYSFNRHNEVSLNLGFLKGSYNSDYLRANLALMTGSYANANLASEPDVFKNIFEANAGVKISSTKNLWIDAGIFASHIGFESAIGKDAWNLTRSILADNTPYFETGAKISYTTDNGKWLLSGLYLNGWQRIERVNGNSLPSFGSQLTYKPNASMTFNYSTFIGTDKPDSARLMRYYHNLYWIFQFHDKIGFTLGFDYGQEESSVENASMNELYALAAIFRFTINAKTSIDVRGEYYSDEHGIIIPTGTPNGFKTSGISTNLDFKIHDNVLWRTEIRNFMSKDEIFVKDGEPVKNNMFITTSLAVSF